MKENKIVFTLLSAKLILIERAKLIMKERPVLVWPLS